MGVEDFDHFAEITTRRLFATTIQVAQLLKRGLAPQSLKENQHTIIQIELSKAPIALAAVWGLVLHHLAEDVKTTGTKVGQGYRMKDLNKT